MTSALHIPHLWLPRRRHGLVLLDNPRKVRRSRGAAPVQPDALSGLQLWLKSDTGMFQDEAKTSPCTADGQSVRGWSDQSGQGTTVTTFAAAPPYAKYQTNIINGKPVMRGKGTTDGGDQLLIISSNLAMLQNVAGASAFAVAAARTTNASVGYVTLLGGTGTQRFSLQTGTVLGVSLRTRRLDADSVDAFSAGTVALNTFYYLTGIADYAGGTRKIYQNGVQVGSESGLSAGNTSNTASTNSSSVGGNSNDYDLAEVILYNRVLTSGERAGIEAYLKARYAL